MINNVFRFLILTEQRSSSKKKWRIVLVDRQHLLSFPPSLWTWSSSFCSVLFCSLDHQHVVLPTVTAAQGPVPLPPPHNIVFSISHTPHRAHHHTTYYTTPHRTTPHHTTPHHTTRHHTTPHIYTERLTADSTDVRTMYATKSSVALVIATMASLLMFFTSWSSFKIFFTLPCSIEMM